MAAATLALAACGSEAANADRVGLPQPEAGSLELELPTFVDGSRSSWRTWADGRRS